jgi:type IV pilus assembly protein PilB
MAKNKLNMKFGDLLLEAEMITDEQLEEALQLHKQQGKKIGEILLEKNYVTNKQIIQTLEIQLGIDYVDLETYPIDKDVPELISERMARRYTLIPIKVDGNNIYVAMADPLDIYAMDDVHLATGYDVKPLISTEEAVIAATDKYFRTGGAEQALEEFDESFGDAFSIDTLSEQSAESIKNAPVVKLINTIIYQAVKSAASDIHIEPFEENVRVRYRIDGELQSYLNIAKHIHSAIVTRIKIMGKMDIAEKRIPQDGRVEAVIEGYEIDMRLSILPTVHGEKIVIRILNRNNTIMNKEQIGFTPENLESFDKIIQSPHGIILLVGPTGSGKTTTLYAVLRELNDIKKNIITVEDPVEYRLNGISHVQVNNKAGLTFANSLRSILRQDPDVVMIGEIRDTETAQIAVRASITGHLVLSTVHTNDTASTIARLVDMGVEEYLVSSSLTGIIAQRLVKKICPYCKEEYQPTEFERSMLNIDPNVMLYKGLGCNVCNMTGYKGRTAIHEVLPVTDKLRSMITDGANTQDLKQEAVNNGMMTLRDSAKRLVVQGVTTMEELIKMTYSID